MADGNESGELRVSGDAVVYQTPLGGWSVPIDEIRLIAAFTNSDGPHLDDYFLVFLTAPKNGWHQASFYAEGRDEALTTLGSRLGTVLECGLNNSTEYKTRIMWPPRLTGQPLMEVMPLKPQNFWQKLTYWGVREIRLSAAARSVLERRKRPGEG